MSSRSSCGDILSCSQTSSTGRRRPCAAGRDQHRRQRHEAGEALRADRALAAAAAAVGVALDHGGGRVRGERGRLAAVELGDPVDPLARLLDQLGRALDARVLLEAERPRDQQPRHGVVGVEHVVAQLAVGAELALDVPGHLVGDPDLGGAGRVAELPRGAARRTGAGRSRAAAGSRARPWSRTRPCRGCARAGTRARPRARASSRRGRTARPRTAGGTGRPCAAPSRPTASCSTRTRSACGGRSRCRSSPAAPTPRPRRPTP